RPGRPSWATTWRPASPAWATPSGRDGMIELSAVQNLVASWWFEYDHGSFEAWPAYFTADAHFSCRSDSGQTPFEDFFRADVSGRDEVVAWQVEHRRNSPYPLRHNGTNIHLTAQRTN